MGFQLLWGTMHAIGKFPDRAVHSLLMIVIRTAATSLREKKWQEMMDQITDKPDWHNKVSGPFP